MKPMPWFVPLPGARSPTTRLFAFPFSGGSAHSYRSWNAWISPHIEVLGVQLPGRGMRIAEALITSMDALVDQVLPAMLPLLDKPYILFGHSNGALMAYAVLNRLLALGAPRPQGIILSGKRSPTVGGERERYSDLSDDLFMQKLRELDGTPKELLEHPEMFRLFGPVIRADFMLGDNFELGKVEAGVAAIPALIMAGKQDMMTVEDVFAWSALFPASRTVAMEGKHFFIDTAPEFPRTVNGFCNATSAAPGAALRA